MNNDKLFLGVLLAAVLAVSGCTGDSSVTPGGERTVQVNGSVTCYSFTDMEEDWSQERSSTVCFEPQEIVIDPDEDTDLEQHDFDVYGETTVSETPVKEEK